MARYEKDYNLHDQAITCACCMNRPKTCRACDDGYNEIKVNQLRYTLKELQVVYDTEQLRDLFTELLDDGYTGLGLGLIIDLIKQRLDTI